MNSSPKNVNAENYRKAQTKLHLRKKYRLGRICSSLLFSNRIWLKKTMSIQASAMLHTFSNTNLYPLKYCICSCALSMVFLFITSFITNSVVSPFVMYVSVVSSTKTIELNSNNCKEKNVSPKWTYIPVTFEMDYVTYNITAS